MSAFQRPDPHFAELIIENAVEFGIFTMEADGRILSWSPGAERILGYSAQEAVGALASMLFTESDRAAGSDCLELKKALETGRAEDSRWHLRRDGSRFWANGVTMRFEHGGGAALLKILRDETPAKLAEEQRVLLLNELNHRVKNTLAMVQSIAEQTLKASGVADEPRTLLAERLVALSEAHDILVRENWAGADLGEIVAQSLRPHQEGVAGRLKADGPPVRLSPQQAVSVSLVLHELMTNAVKYGALGTAGGEVAVLWNVSHDGQGRRYLTFLWREAGGPGVEPPTRRGFGTKLIERAFSRDGGVARLDFEPAGLRCVIDLPLSAHNEIPSYP